MKVKVSTSAMTGAGLGTARHESGVAIRHVAQTCCGKRVRLCGFVEKQTSTCSSPQGLQV